MVLTRDKLKDARKRLSEVVEAGLKDVMDSHSEDLEDAMEKYEVEVKKQRLQNQISLNTTTNFNKLFDFYIFTKIS